MKTYVLMVTILNKRKRYVLPQEKSTDYTIPLQKKFFQALNQDIHLNLEVLDGKWRLKKNEGYYFPERNEYIQEAKDFEQYGFLELKEFSDGGEQDQRYSNGRHTLVLCLPQGKNAILEFKSYENLFRPYRKYQIQGQNEILIAADRKNADIYWNAWSEWSVKIVRNQMGHEVVCEHLQGFFLNGTLIAPKDGKQPLRFGDVLDLWGLHLIYLDNEIAVEEHDKYLEIRERQKLLPITPIEAAEESSYGSNQNWKYQRSVREKLGISILPEEMEIAKPKEHIEEEKKSLFMTIGPSFTMMIPMALGCFLMLSASNSAGQQTAMFRIVGLSTSVLSAVIGMMWTLWNLHYQKNKQKEEQMRWSQIHADYFKKIYDDLGEKYETTVKEMNHLYPSADKCMDMQMKDGKISVLETEYTTHHLWERNKTQKDFLKHRIGIGNLPFQVKVRFQQLEKPDYDAGRHSYTYENYKEAVERAKYENLIQVPILLDLQENSLIGIVSRGREKSSAVAFAKALSAQIVSWNCYTEVKLAYIYDETVSDDSSAWEFAKWLPHTWSKDKDCRYIASNRKESKDVFYALSNIFRDRMENSQDGLSGEKMYLPHYIVFISDASLLYGEIFAKYAYEKEHNIGLTTIILTEEKNNLPNECTYIVELSGENEGQYYDIAQSGAEHQTFHFDKVQDDKLDLFSRMLSRIQVAETEAGGELPEQLTFFEMYGVKKPEELKSEERWKKNKPYDHLEGMLGQMAGGMPCVLDLHEKMHGPHGLLGGTTGSGKSETLQTYLLSLAVNYSPNDVAYFLIDYKGEGMAGLFERLPHKIGQMSNLSANQANRIMISIRTENMRREQIFSENGVKNINEYRKLYEESEENQSNLPILPHLFIVIDEFAQLKRDNPEFIDQLISVSQVGRSLGVHLILATQTPGNGTVSGNIASNSKFKICLRMQSKEDSMAMIGKKDAAYITHAGRGYLQVGMDELYEQFQSGYSGAAYLGEKIEQSNSKALLIEGKPALIRTEGSVTKYIQKERAIYQWTAQMIVYIHTIAKNMAVSKVFQDNVLREQFLNRFYGYLNAENNIARAQLEDEEALKPDYERSDYMDKRILHFLNDYLNLPSEVKRLSVGEQIYQLFLHSDRKYPEKKKETQLSATIQYLAKIAANDKAYRTAYRISKPLLKDKIYLEEAKFSAYTRQFFQNETGWQAADGSNTREVVAGYMDDPANLLENEKQKPYVIDFIRDGNAVIYGRAGSGKSTLMQTLMYGLVLRYSPDEVRIYVADFDKNAMAYFKEAPHIEQMVDRNHMKQFWDILNVLNEELEIRRKRYGGHDYKKYLEMQKMNTVRGEHTASIFVFIDNFGEAARELQKLDNHQYDALMKGIVKESASMGIYFILSGGDILPGEVPREIAQCMSEVICLEIEDDTKYANLLRSGRLRICPEKDVKGRGLAVYEKGRVLEFQAAMAVKAPNGELEERLIEDSCKRMKLFYGNRNQSIIGKNRKFMGIREFLNNEQVKKRIQSPYDFPIGYDEDKEVYSISLPQLNCFGICRYAADGKGVNFFETCVRIAMEKQARIFLIDDGTEWSSQFQGYSKITVISDENEVWKLMQDDSNLWKAFVQRNQEKARLFGNRAVQGTVLFDALKTEEPYFIFIKNMPWFTMAILRQQNGIVTYNRWIALWQKGNQHHIYTFAEFLQDEKEVAKLKFVRNTEIQYKESLKSLQLPEDTLWPVQAFFEQNTGIQLGGNIARASKSGYQYQFGEMSRTEKEKPERTEIGYLTSEKSGMVRIQVPSAEEGGKLID